MYYFNFYVSEDFLLFDHVFLLQARKLKCKDLKRENNCTYCRKVQKQKMSQGPTHFLSRKKMSEGDIYACGNFKGMNWKSLRSF